MPNFTQYGDTTGRLGGFRHAGDQTLPSGGPGFLPDVITLIGDAEALAGFARGGNDTATGVGYATVVIGDARSMSGFSRGGADLLTASGGNNTLYGDAVTMSGFALGGDDHLIFGGGIGARTGATNTLFGDAETMTGFARGGDDVLTGPSSIYSSESFLYGDARTLSGHAWAGNDTLIGVALQTEHMWGDAAEIEGKHVHTGDDTFVFARLNGTDFIHDFEQGKDLIDLTGYAAADIHDFADLQPLITVAGEDSTITFGSHQTGRFPGEMVVDSIAVLGVAALTAEDFLFA
jgi:serralysin